MELNLHRTPNSTDQPISDLSLLLCSLQPMHHHGVYVFAAVTHGMDLAILPFVAVFREAEAITVIVEESAAQRANLPVLFRAAWITLTVHSDLHAVGLTAAVAGALGSANIPCNVVAAAYHDHLFVPVEAVEQALDCLRVLQERATRDASAPAIN